MTRHIGPGPGRGTSLVEALVAMAVMAFGMLAVVGIQTSLRQNADVAKQRSEAVRIAQEAMEVARDFSTIDSANGLVAYADIANVPQRNVAGLNANYSLTQGVVPRTAPDRKELRIAVAWTDRSGQDQNVVLNSVIGANDPRISRALGAQPKGIAPRQPSGRHPAVPPQAKDVGGGLSAFKPPAASGSGTIVWVFDNLSGMIVGVCNAVTTGQASLSATDVQSCSNNTTAQPLSGFVRFATELTQPTAANAENPISTALNLAIGLALTSHHHPNPSHACFAEAPGTSVAAASSTVVPYYCAIFSNAARIWSGLSSLTPLGFSDTGNEPWTPAANAADFAAARYRVCRYTPATSDAVTVPNRQHPRHYADVTALEPLRDQNFLVIRAGNDTVPFLCPTDVMANPVSGDLINSNTLVHQPAP